MKRIIYIATLILLPWVVFAQSEQKHSRIEKNLSIYNDILRLLDIMYVDTLNYDKLMTTSINSCLNSLDPYTVYIPEEDTEDLTFMTTGTYGGIGALIVQRDEDVMISEPYEGMPAQKAGLKAGDLLLKIDGESARGKSTAEVSAMLRGVPHDKISIVVKRRGEKKNLTFEFEREKIQINPVSYAGCVAPGIGYIKLTEFTENAASEFKNGVKDMVNQDQINSLIIDLRDNGGGIIEEAVKILSMFVPKGTEVVSTKGKIPQVETSYKTLTDPLFPDMKVAVLVNRFSASAAEIVAGVFQDLDRGVLIGERTFGKGLVQNIRPLSYGGNLKLTTAKYYIPSGRCIQAIDYSHRNEDGSVGRVPDSLTTVFLTKRGREVRDGGGVSPDIEVKQPEGINICYYLFVENMFFDYATEYCQRHPSIAPAQEFTLTDEDFADFEAFLTKKEFTYQTQTASYLESLKDLIKFEQLDSIAANELKALEEIIKPNISEELKRNRKEIEEMLGSEIIKRYYYQKGDIIYTLRTNKDFSEAKELLNDEKRYKKILNMN
ncbi:MAG: S41 family peptidase [Bacteroidetes bacterium]|uniref:S41 family peptidase n=1 Tax=Candidatus Gallipaludibacter merdavium TaxID=2840839 RepID=A0A9D9HRN4_9BACT|nr:S41 family peptidase [Candidatus Gallipaludibacter merdavium]